MLGVKVTAAVSGPVESLGEHLSVFTDCDNCLGTGITSLSKPCLKTVSGSLKNEKTAKESRNVLMRDYAKKNPDRNQHLNKSALAKIFRWLSHLPPPPPSLAGSWQYSNGIY